MFGFQRHLKSTTPKRLSWIGATVCLVNELLPKNKQAGSSASLAVQIPLGAIEKMNSQMLHEIQVA